MTKRAWIETDSAVQAVESDVYWSIGLEFELGLESVYWLDVLWLVLRMFGRISKTSLFLGLMYCPKLDIMTQERRDHGILCLWS